MRNPLKRYSKARGLPDSAVHHGDGAGDYQHHLHHSDALALVPPQSKPGLSAGSAPATHPPVPAGYPTVMGGYGYNNNRPTIEPPIAMPYEAPQDENKEAEAAWEFNAGNNKNKKGHQKAGNIKVGNSTNGSLPFTLPQNGRFVFNAGNNVNEGEMQEGGNVEFANIYAKPN